MAWDGRVPIHDSGEVLEWVGITTGGSAWRWTDNRVFDATLVYDGYARGRSAAHLRFHDKSTGVKHTVFLGDFWAVVAIMVRGEASGKWTYCKRGQNFGTMLVPPNKEA